MHTDVTNILVLSLFVSLVLFVLLFAAVYTFLQKKKARRAREEKDRSEVGFVVETFHELVAKLKDKEKELEQLRAVAEEKAVSIEAYNENILQSVASGVISIDSEMYIRSMNQAAEVILGVGARNSIGKRFDSVFHEPLRSLMSGENTVSRAEYSYITQDNRHIWLGITTSELKSTAGEKIGRIFVFTDLTDIKTLQAQMELKERLSQLGEMSAGIAHELRNSMSVITGYAKLLGRKAEPEHIPTVESIANEIQNMDRIISELLAFARPSVLNTERVALNELVEEAATSAAGTGSNIKVTIDGDGNIAVKADTVLLRQAFFNLFMNAVEAMPDGGDINVRFRRIHSNAEVSIRDTGYGIPEDIRQKIFLPFFTTKPNGTGFGLAFVQKTIVSHEGSIEVEGGSSRGAGFIVKLPVFHEQ